MTFLAAALAQLPVALLGLNLEQFLLDTGPWVLVVLRWVCCTSRWVCPCGLRSTCW